jgi:hypothetical protein
MPSGRTGALAACVQHHAARLPELAALGARLATLGDAPAERLLPLYEAALPVLEAALWPAPPAFDTLLADFQALHRERERLIAECGSDDRHDFVIGIPVADRPAHLRACLESIYQVCLRYDYGGRKEGRWHKVRVIVGEDSAAESHRQAHRDLVREYSARGLDVHHLDFDEQYALLDSLPATLRPRLGRLLTTQPREHFHHKGQAANRNLLYLKFREVGRPGRTLYYLLDSDQSLCVNRITPDGIQAVYAIPYFHVLDRIFREHDIWLLSGKMVGDPPVSPAVMAVNCVQDITHFFRRLANVDPQAPCSFHATSGEAAGGASYHDLARLFGFTPPASPVEYLCELTGPHDHMACLSALGARLNRFFQGEHPTRHTHFVYGEGLDRVSPARTVYPGNYVARHEGLRYIIPFAHLRLRMSGPTAGRLIAAEIGARFATCNLPNLHRRNSGKTDFRPGVEIHAGHIDLADEFERQFFGDLMLFSAEALVKEADVRQPFPRSLVEAVVARKEAELLALYGEKHATLERERANLMHAVFESGGWWLKASPLAPTLAEVRRFLANLAHNFGDGAAGWLAIQSPHHRARRRAQIIDALVNYRAERDAWDSLFPPTPAP